MLIREMEVEFEGEQATVIAQSANGQQVNLESTSHPYPGVEVPADLPLRILFCPVCQRGHCTVGAGGTE